MRPGLILRAPDAADDAATGGGCGMADEAPADDEVVTITRAELDELRRAASHPAPEARDDRPDEALRVGALTHERELAEAARRSAELERAYKAALRDRELATALVGKALVPGAATQLISLWRDAFEVVDDDGAIRVVSKEGQAVDRAVADRLSSPEFAHFCLPSSRGGTAQRGQNRSSNPAPAPAAPRTLGEAVVRQWREAAAGQVAGSRPTGWGRTR